MLAGVAFVLRLAAALLPPDHFWAYTAYFDMATQVVRGGGYCLAPGTLCAYFPPVYPTVLAACILTGHPRPAIVLVSCLIGAATVWLVYRIGNFLFGNPSAWIAAAYAAVYPYYVWHDAVLQETATLTLVVAIAMYLLIRSHRSASFHLALAAGIVLGLAVLTKANLGLFVPLASGWMLFFSSGNSAVRARRCVWTLLGVCLVVGAWVARTWIVTGSPVIYSNAGEALWQSNHALTFDYFPRQSIDAANDAEWKALSPEDRKELDALAGPDDGDVRPSTWSMRLRRRFFPAQFSATNQQGIRQSEWFWRRGMAFIKAHPWLTLRRAALKVWIAFSPVFSPAKSAAFEAVYLVFWLPLLVLSVLGGWKSRAQWRDCGYFYTLILSFALGSAVFWGHSSHRMYVEPYLMILAARGIAEVSRSSAPVSGPPSRYSAAVR